MNFAHNVTTIKDLGDYFNEEDGVRKEGFISGRGMVGEEYYVIGMMEGEQIGAFYLPTYVALQDGEFVYESATGGFTTDLAEAKRTIIGYATPELEIWLDKQPEFSKAWHLDFSFRAMIGNKVYNATHMFFDDPGLLESLNAVPEAIDWYAEGRTSAASLADFYVEDASFVRLDYLALSYDFQFGENHNVFRKLTVFTFLPITSLRSQVTPVPIRKPRSKA